MREVTTKAWALFVGFSSLTLASQSKAAELRVGPVFLDRFPEVEAVLEIQESEPTGPLPKASDLTLLEDGRPTVPAQSIRTFQATGRGLAVVVAVDASRTMAGKPIEQIRKALLSLVGALAPQDRIALVSFSDDVRVEAPFGAPVDQVQARAAKLAPRGRITELYRALFKSLSLFTPGLPERRHVLVISDGRDEGEAYELDDVISLAKSKGIPVDAIGLTRIDPKYLSNLERLADLTGGSYSPATNAGDLESLVRKGLERLRSTPVATFRVRDLTRDDQPHRLGVRWRQAGRVLEDETTVRTPAETPGSPSTEETAGYATLLWAGGVALLLLVVAAAVWKAMASRRAVPAPQPAAGGLAASGRLPAVRQEPSAALDLPLLAGASPATRREEEQAPQPAPEPGPSRSRPARARTQIRHEFTAPSVGHPAAVLVVEEGNEIGERFPIEQDPFWIGAAEDNQLALSQDEFLSSHHACIQYRDGTLLLYDNRSTNGTYVNGERLDAVPRPLGLGDRVQVGHSTFVVMTP